uniref:Uncharacterized protein n=1 Tax=Arundo donax TaxID=35708 RepID=A0A0A8YMJ7_ARUDO
MGIIDPAEFIQELLRR